MRFRLYFGHRAEHFVPCGAQIKKARQPRRFPSCTGEFFVFLGDARHFLDGRNTLLDLLPTVIP
jgi:hypothetical protein